MDMKIPDDLIKQVQISIQKESKIQLNEQHSTFPSSLEETIAAIDGSPDHLKCKHCKARLLRDQKRSLFCFFCGRQQQEEADETLSPRQPIKFRDTIGYRWLLNALECDGNEVVSLSVDRKEVRRGQRSWKDEKKLSDLLDLEIKWPSEIERLEGVLSSGGKSVLDRVGVYIDDDDDDFFPDVRADSVSNVFETKKSVDHVQSGASQVQGNVSLFENVQPPEIALEDSEEKTGDSSFTGWEANFQFAGNENAGLMSKGQVHSKKDIAATETEDFQTDKNMRLFESAEHSQTVAERSRQSETSDDFSGWDAEFQSADSGALNKGPKSPDPFPSSEVDLSTHMDTVFGSVEIFTDIEAENNTTTTPSTKDNWFQDDMWGNFNSDIGTQGSNSEMIVNSKVRRHAEDENISSFDNIDWGKNDQWQTSSLKESKDKAMDDSFDVWSDFTSSAKSVDPSFSLRDQNASHSQSSPGQSSEIDFFATNNNTQVSNIGSISPPDFFSGVSIVKSSPKEANVVEKEGSAIDREASETPITQGNIEVTEKDEGLSHTADANVAESMISQMHDLSFMLENHISIPKS